MSEKEKRKEDAWAKSKEKEDARAKRKEKEDARAKSKEKEVRNGGRELRVRGKRETQGDKNKVLDLKT